MLGLYLLSFPIVIYFSSFCLPVELSGIKKIILFSYLLIYFWLCWVFVAAQAFFFFSLVVANGDHCLIEGRWHPIAVASLVEHRL